jgi:hypothetical protein
MCELFRLIFGLVVDLFRSRAALEAEVLVLKQQIIVLRRGKSHRMPFLAVDRFVLGWVCHLFPKARDALAIVRPDTVVRWHHAGFRLFWRWKSRRRLGRPAVPTEIRQLIREMSIANAKQIMAATSEQPIKDALKTKTEEAVMRGVFGAPTFFVGEQMFFGQDRLTFATRAVSRLYDYFLRDAGLNITQFSLLRLIDQNKDLSVSTLARYMVMDRTSITRALVPLERDGLI